MAEKKAIKKNAPSLDRGKVEKSKQVKRISSTSTYEGWTKKY